MIDTTFKNAVDEIKQSDLKLGVTVQGIYASFKMWSPTAINVQILLFPNSISAGTKNSNGEWDQQPIEPPLDHII